MVKMGPVGKRWERLQLGKKKPGDQRCRPERDRRSENRTDKKKGSERTEWKIIGAGVCVPVWRLCVWWVNPLCLDVVSEFPSHY